jgi:hypothetical protein
MSHSIEYFVEIEEDNLLKGPFETLMEAIRLLKVISKGRLYTHEQARQFFLYGSAIVKTEMLDDHVDGIRIGWLATQQSETQEPEMDEFTRNRDRFAVAKEHVLPLQVESNSSVPD